MSSATRMAFSEYRAVAMARRKARVSAFVTIVEDELLLLLMLSEELVVVQFEEFAPQVDELAVHTERSTMVKSDARMSFAWRNTWVGANNQSEGCCAAVGAAVPGGADAAEDEDVAAADAGADVTLVREVELDAVAQAVTVDGEETGRRGGFGGEECAWWADWCGGRETARTAGRLSASSARAAA